MPTSALIGFGLLGLGWLAVATRQPAMALWCFVWSMVALSYAMFQQVTS